MVEYPRLESYAGHTCLSIKDDYGRVRNLQFLIAAETGHGKTLTTEAIVEEYYRAGYLVLCIADPKNEWEFAYQMFKPKEEYHLQNLRKQGKHPEEKSVKLYHPFTFNLPSKEYLPEMNLFTFSLKEMRRPEWSLISESNWDTETIRILLRASQDISSRDNLYSFAHYMQDSIKGKSSGKKKVADSKNFYLESSSGSMKTMSEISNYLYPFKNDFFISSDSCRLNLNWKEIMSDRKHYHVFLSSFLKDDKLKDFVVLVLLNGIINNKQYLKYPVVIVIPEVRTLCPFRPEGHKIFLAQGIKQALSMIRSSGRGMSSVLDTQVFLDVDENIRNTSNCVFLGQIGSENDRVAKIYNYRREEREKLRRMEYGKGSYLIKGHEEDEIVFWFPSSMHCEEHYNFFEMYRKHKKPVKKYSEEIKYMRNLIAEDEEKIRQRIKSREKEEKERKKREQKEKEAKSVEKHKSEKKEKKIEELEKQTKLQKMKLCYERFYDESLDKKERSYRKIAEKMGLKSHITAKKYIQEYEKYLVENSRHGEDADKGEEINVKSNYNEIRADVEKMMPEQTDN